MDYLGVLACALIDLHGTRNTVTTVENRVQRAAEEQERLLAERVAAATADQVKHRLEQDVKVLRDRFKGQDHIAKQAALDSKYLSQRQAFLAF